MARRRRYFYGQFGYVKWAHWGLNCNGGEMDRVPSTESELTCQRRQIDTKSPRRRSSGSSSSNRMNVQIMRVVKWFAMNFPN